MKIILEKYRY